MFAVGCRFESLPLFGHNTGQLHQRSGLMPAATKTKKTKRFQILGYPAAAIHRSWLLVNRTNLRNQSLPRPGRRATSPPVRVTASAHSMTFNGYTFFSISMKENLKPILSRRRLPPFLESPASSVTVHSLAATALLPLVVPSC